jgi:KGK domain
MSKSNQIMTNQPKQIIPDLQAVAHFLFGTFLISDLLEGIKAPIDDPESFINQLRELHLELKNGGYSRDHYQDKVEVFIANNTIIEDEENVVIKLFEDGIDCKLLQPDGKGWQKGKLRICFEFTPENNENLIAIPDDSVKMPESPLDEIRQLANSFPINQN